METATKDIKDTMGIHLTGLFLLALTSIYLFTSQPFIYTVIGLTVIDTFILIPFLSVYTQKTGKFYLTFDYVHRLVLTFLAVAVGVNYGTVIFADIPLTFLYSLIVIFLLEYNFKFAEYVTQAQIKQDKKDLEKETVTLLEELDKCINEERSKGFFERMQSMISSYWFHTSFQFGALKDLIFNSRENIDLLEAICSSMEIKDMAKNVTFATLYETFKLRILGNVLLALIVLLTVI